jgi:hypothetical protein
VCCRSSSSSSFSPAADAFLLSDGCSCGCTCGCTCGSSESIEAASSVSADGGNEDDEVAANAKYGGGDEAKVEAKEVEAKEVEVGRSCSPI